MSVDTQLVDDGGPPDAFVAVASQRDLRMDPYTIVQLPGAADEDEDDGAVADADASADRIAAAVAAAESRAAADAASAVASAESRARADAASAISAAEAAARAVAAAETEITRLASMLAERTSQAAAFAHELDEARAAAESARLTAAEELDELIARVDRAERKSAELAAALASTQTDTGHADASAAEHEGLERTLRERAQVIRELEAEVARRERLVRDLAGALEEANVASFEGGSPTATYWRRVSTRWPSTWRAGRARLRPRRGRTRSCSGASPSPSARHPRPPPVRRVRRPRPLRLRGRRPAGRRRRRPRGVPPPGCRPRRGLEALRRALVQEHEARVRAETETQGGDSPDPA